MNGLNTLIASAIFVGAVWSCSEADSVSLASKGEALLPIVIGPNADERMAKAAESLAHYLGRIGGAEFKVEKGKGDAGIVAGCPQDFEDLPFKIEFESGPFNREEYILKSTATALYLIGATAVAVEHAVWDLLHRLGYRQFFPGEKWEVVPKLEKVAIDVDVREKPDFYARRIWYNWGLWGYNNKPYAEWCARNRAVKGFDLNSGHSYGGIISANRKEFTAHPEYGALIGGERKLSKFCVSNPGLRKLVVEHAKRVFAKKPILDSISMDPSDGGGWCECQPCEAMGGVSNRVLTLANEVATAINSLGLGEKYVGMYAYNKHCAPPTIKAHPNVIVSVTTAFLTGGWTFDRIVEGWQKQGATIGVYDYYSVIAWDWNKPLGARGARPSYMASSLRKFYGQGARFLDAESGDAWGPYGLGYYVASRIMWDVDEADRVQEIVDDFLTRAFGPAREPMSKFYHLITADDTKRSNGDLLGRMYRHLAEARTAADSIDVKNRIDDLILYTRYFELYEAFSTGGADKNQVLKYAHRIRKTMMIHSYGIWARLASQREANGKEHPAISDEAPFTEAEIQKILKDGIAKNQPVDINLEMVDFGTDLVPAFEALKLKDVTPGTYPPVPQDRQTYYVWVEKAPAEISLTVTVKHVWNLRPHKVSLFSPKDVFIKAVDTSDICKPDGKPRDVTLKTPHDGLHRIETNDGGDYTRIEWPKGMPVTLPSAMDTPAVKNHFRGAWSLYFYVPKGTKFVGGWASRIANWAPAVSGTMLDPDGDVALDFKAAKAGWFKVDVKPGHDGKLWKFQDSHGDRRLVTVPPYFARTAQDLLLPKEVVERDSKSLENK